MEPNELKSGNHFINETTSEIECTFLGYNGEHYLYYPRIINQKDLIKQGEPFKSLPVYSRGILLTEEHFLNIKEFDKKLGVFYNDVLVLEENGMLWYYDFYPNQTAPRVDDIQYKRKAYIKYLHELQNLYHAVKRKELTFKNK